MTKPTDPFSQVTRFELIDNGGRRIVVWDPSVKITVMLQDDDRTLKVFVAGDARWMPPWDEGLGIKKERE